MRCRTLVAAAALLAATACDRSPVEAPGHELLGQVVILDRSTTPHTPLATWTHGAGWDAAELMRVSHATEAHRTRVSLGVQMLNRGGEPIALAQGGEFSARYHVVSDPGGVVDMDAGSLFHGDHVHVYGHHAEGRAGTARLTFALWHVDHADAETTPIDLTFTE
jgi:hypothetical protein